MIELFKIAPWIIYVPTVVLLIIVVGHRLAAKYGDSKEGCPNCKALDSCRLEYEGTIDTSTHTAVSRQGIPHKVVYKRFKRIYSCDSCKHKWETIENYRS